MLRIASCALFAVATLSLAEVAVAAPVVVAVPNYSFESPTVNPVGIGVSLTIDNWTTTGPDTEKVDLGNGPQNSGVGIFPNPGTLGRIQNADQNQLAYMFSNSTHTLSQTLPAQFQAGQYNLTVGVANATAIPTPGDTLSIQLYYVTTAAPSVPVIIATRNVVEGTDALSQSQLNYFTATTTLGAGDVAVGKAIGVLFTTTGIGGGEFDLDNVSIPEPASLGLAGIAVASLLMRRRTAR